MIKGILNILGIVAVTLGLMSCFENPNLVYDKGTVVEFNTAVITAPAAGRTFPLIAVNNGAGELQQRVNLVGPQRPAESTVRVSVDKANTTAVEGTHFRIVSSNGVVIPANNSFGNLVIEILRAPAAAGTTVNVVFLLEGNGSDITPSENYKRVGYTIRL
jgi:hypothetical protein